MREGGKTLCQRSGSSIGPDKNSWLLTFRLPLFFLFFFCGKAASDYFLSLFVVKNNKEDRNTPG